MKVGDKCKYMSLPLGERWKTGIIVGIKGPYSAKVYTVVGINEASGELVTKTSHYVVEMK